MNLNDKLKLEKFGMTHNQIRELKAFLVERYVDNMSTKDLVSYVTDDLDRYYEKMSDADFLEDAYNYWEDSFDEVVEDIKNILIVNSKRTEGRISVPIIFPHTNCTFFI